MVLVPIQTFNNIYTLAQLCSVPAHFMFVKVPPLAGTTQIGWGGQTGIWTFRESIDGRPYKFTVRATLRFSVLVRVISVWRKVRNRDRTALRAIPV